MIKHGMPLASGEVTAPDNIGEIPSLKYWMVEGLAAWKAQPRGVKYAAKTTNKLLLRRILMPAVANLEQNFDASSGEDKVDRTARLHCREVRSSSPVVTPKSAGTAAHSPSTGDGHEPQCHPLQYINMVSHDFADKQLVLWILKLNLCLNRKAGSLPFHNAFRHDSI